MPLVEVSDEVTTESFIVKAGNDYATVFLRYYANKPRDGHQTYSGTICIHSGYGTHGHFWSCMGEPLREFLTDVDDGYLLSKISRSETNYEQGEERLKREVVKSRRRRRITADEAREAFDRIESAFSEYGGREAAFSLYHDGSLAGAVEDWCDLFVSDFPQNDRMFVKRVWPEIVAALKPVTV